MPTLNTRIVAQMLARELHPKGWQIGVGEPNCIILYQPVGVNLSTPKHFKYFLFKIVTESKIKINEKMEFHFYKEGSLLGGIVLDPAEIPGRDYSIN